MHKSPFGAVSSMVIPVNAQFKYRKRILHGMKLYTKDSIMKVQLIMLMIIYIILYNANMQSSKTARWYFINTS